MHHCPSNPNLPSAALVNSLALDGTLSSVACRYMIPWKCDGSTRSILLDYAEEGVQAGLLHDEQESIVAGLLKPDMVPMERGCSGQGVVIRFSTCLLQTRLLCLPMGRWL